MEKQNVEAISFYIKEKQQSKYLNDHLIIKWFYEAKKVFKFKGEFFLFRDCVINEIFYDRAAVEEERIISISPKGQVNGSFQKKPHHKKKVLSEKDVVRKNWRKRKKNQKDFKKPFKFNPKNVKRTLQKSERKRIKEKIKKATWEQYPTSSTYWEVKDCHQECCQFKEKSWEYNYPANDWDDFIEYDKEKISVNLWVYCYY